MQRTIRAHVIQHGRHEIDRHAAVILRYFPPALISKARPQPQYIPRLICQHAVELERWVDQLRHFDVAVTEAHRARQRQLERIDARDFGVTRVHLTVSAQPHDPDRLTRRQLTRSELRGLHGCCTDELRIVGDDREIVDGVDVDHMPGHFNGTGERDRDVTDRHRHGVTVDNDEAALCVHDEAGAVIVTLGDTRHRVGHVESHRDERRSQRCEARILVLRELR